MIFFLSTLDEGLRCQEKYHNSDKMQIESECKFNFNITPIIQSFIVEGMHF